MLKQASPRQTVYNRPGHDPHQWTERDGSPTWLTRADGFITAITRARAGTILARDNQEESMLILSPGQAARLQAGEQAIDAQGCSLTIVPPGKSNITITQAGWVYRLYGAGEPDLAGIAANAGQYLIPGTDTPLPPPPAWPRPRDGWKIRHYRLDDYIPKDNDELILPRIFRSSNLMINAFVPFRTPRPEDAMRPHWHDDFDQASVTIEGKWAHYARTPWGSDMRQWRPDMSFEVDSPSVAIFPATIIHTSRNLTNDAWMLDIFGPPRLDLARAGLVLNGDEYPMPDENQATSGHNIPSAWTKA